MAKVEDKFYDELDKGKYYLPPAGRYTGRIARKNEVSFITPYPKHGLINYALEIAAGDEQGHWAWATLNTKNLESVPEENIESAKVGYGITHRTIKSIGKATKQEFGLKDKKDWTTAELTEYVVGILTSADSLVFNFTVKHRVKDGAPSLDNRGNPRYDVYVNKVE